MFAFTAFENKKDKIKIVIKGKQDDKAEIRIVCRILCCIFILGEAIRAL
jgi:hypothetical protein